MSVGVRSMRLSVGRPRPVQWVSLMTSLWLLGSWTVVLVRDSPQPASRWMLGAMAAWLWLVWPVWRLSVAGAGDGGPRTARGGVAWSALIEWACVGLVLQAAIWPLRALGDWGTELTLWLDAWVLGWGLWGAAWVAWSGVAWEERKRGRWAGTIAAGGWLVVMFGAGAVSGVSGWGLPMWLNPWGGLGAAIRVNLGDQASRLPEGMWAAALAVGVSALLAWAAAALAQRRAGGSRRGAAGA
ncbi:MAG: hypothetical protein AAGI54_06335 [Planctomycetota bacterium]